MLETLPNGQFGDVLYPILSSWMVRGVVLGLLANFLSGVLVALKQRTFRLGAIGDWMAPTLYMIGGGVTLQLVMWAAIPAEYGGALASIGPPLVWGGIILAMVGKILDNAAALGLPVPAVLTDRAKGTTTAAP